MDTFSKFSRIYGQRVIELSHSTHRNIPFKVCKAPATGDCGTGPVKSVTDAFVIQDMLGPAGTSGGTGWMVRVAMSSKIASD
jgi:hypothetical protein